MIQQINPMLAYKPPLGEKGQALIDVILDDKTKLWGYDEKKDGSRYLLHGQSPINIFTGRRTSDVTGLLSETKANDKLSHLNFQTQLLKGTVLDGEYMGTSAAALSQEYYYVFDILFYKGKDIRTYKLTERKKYANEVVQDIIFKYPGSKIEMLPFYNILSKEDFLIHYHRILKNGGEGVVLKNKNSQYISGKRDRNAWVKVKREETFDVVISSYIKSESSTYGKAGFDTFRHLVAIQYFDGDAIEVCHIPATTFSHEDHLKFKSDGIGSLIGKVAEVEAMGRASGGIKLRHPRFKRWRSDKDPQECILD